MTPPCHPRLSVLDRCPLGMDGLMPHPKKGGLMTMGNLTALASPTAEDIADVRPR